MSYMLTQDSLNTNATISATGTTALISSPGANLSLRIRHISWHADTTTTNRMAFGISPSAGANAFYGSVLTAGDTEHISILDGWLVNTNSGVYLVMSATSTPTIRVAIVYDVVDRSR